MDDTLAGRKLFRGAKERVEILSPIALSYEREGIASKRNAHP